MINHVARTGALLILALGVIVLGCRSETPKPKGPSRGWRVQVGDDAPDFLLVTTNAEKMRLSDLKGRVVVANFFATWCGFCLVEVEAFHKELMPRIKGDKRIVLITIDVQDLRPAVADLIREGGYEWPFLLDTDGAVFARYAMSGLPRLVVIDPEGKIAALHAGFGSGSIEELRSEIDPLLARIPIAGRPSAASSPRNEPGAAPVTGRTSDAAP